MLRARIALRTGRGPLKRGARVFGPKTLIALFLSWWSNRYDPARHYMRGPGPACRAKQARLGASLDGSATERTPPTDAAQVSG
jgi:hypothetical protein